jgi:hypothetical protein
MRKGVRLSESGKPVRSVVAQAEEPRLQARLSSREVMGMPLSEPTPWDIEPEEMTGRPCSLPRSLRR